MQHLVALADVLRARGKADEATRVLVRAQRLAGTDPWLELLVAREQFYLRRDLEGRQAIYARALAACARLPRGQAAPWQAPRASFGESLMSHACEADGRLGEGLSHARRAFEGEPRNLFYLRWTRPKRRCVGRPGSMRQLRSGWRPRRPGIRWGACCGSAGVPRRPWWPRGRPVELARKPVGVRFHLPAGLSGLGGGPVGSRLFPGSGGGYRGGGGIGGAFSVVPRWGFST